MQYRNCLKENSGRTISIGPVDWLAELWSTCKHSTHYRSVRLR